MKNKKGFTLVEIMIVVVIIGLLAAMAIPAFRQVRSTAMSKAAINDMRQLAAAADLYFMDHPDATTVVVTVDLVGSGNYVKSLTSGNTYDVNITPLMTELKATVTGGATVSYPLE